MGFIDLFKGKEVVPLSEEQYKALLEGASGRKERAALLLGLNSGIGIDELLGLRWGDVDFKGRAITIAGKNSSRAIYLPGAVLRELEGIRNGQADGTYVFGMDKRTWLAKLASYRGSSGISDLSWSKVRHTYAFFAAQRGEPDYIVARNIGVSISAVLKYYKASPDKLRALADERVLE